MLKVLLAISLTALVSPTTAAVLLIALVIYKSARYGA